MSHNESVVRWLHLTDVHMGMDEQEWLWPTMKFKFRDDLKKIYSDAGPWDLVLFTGDLAQRGSEDDYKKLDEAFCEIWSWFKALGCEPKLLAVPGNHDLVRPLAKRDKPTLSALERWHQEDVARADIWDDGHNPYLSLLNESFKNYMDWWHRTPHRPDNLKEGFLPGDFSYSFSKGNLTLGIVGLNSAFLQLTDKKDYEERLVIHSRQCVSVTPDKNHVDWARAHNTCFLMTHHPMGWLHPDCKTEFFREAMECFSLHLCGHQHETTVLQTLTGGAVDAPLHWTGRSLFGLEKAKDGKVVREHGYVSGKLSLEEEKGLQFWPRRRAEQGNRWALIPDHSVELPDDRRTGVFPVRWLNNDVAQACTVSQTPSTGTFSELIVSKLQAVLKNNGKLHSALNTAIFKQGESSYSSPEQLAQRLADLGFVSVWQSVVGELPSFNGYRDDLRRTLFWLAQTECEGGIINELKGMLEKEAPIDDFVIRIRQRYINLMGLVLNAALGVEFAGGEAFQRNLHMPSEVGLVGERLELDIAKQLMRRLKIIDEKNTGDDVVKANLSELEQSLKALYVSKEPLVVEHTDNKGIGIQYLVQFILPSEEQSGTGIKGAIEKMTQSGDRFINDLLGIIMRKLNE